MVEVVNIIHNTGQIVKEHTATTVWQINPRPKTAISIYQQLKSDRPNHTTKQFLFDDYYVSQSSELLLII